MVRSIKIDYKERSPTYLIFCWVMEGARKIKKKSANKKAGQKNSDKISALERQSEAGKRTFLKLVGETTSNLPATEMLPEIQKSYLIALISLF
jgi:hypothetical protein